MGDLAGSENTEVTGVKGKLFGESVEINKSLVVLGRVINAINENRRRTKGKQIPVPFRESKLTQILADVLNGTFLCSLLLNVSPSPVLHQAHETAKTMAFGLGAKKLNSQSKRLTAEDRKLKMWLDGVWQAV